MLYITLCSALSQRKLETQRLKHRKRSYTLFSRMRPFVGRESKVAMAEALQDHQDSNSYFLFCPPQHVAFTLIIA